MASIFSYDPDPPRVASPWLSPTPSGTPNGSKRGQGTSERILPGTPPVELLTDYNVTKLEPEPQEGPVEFKLHLLLRPRRVYISSSTGIHVAGSQQSRTPGQTSKYTKPPAIAPSNQTRQHRLQQLTTQLLWRLQQSSPYHASTTSDLIIPKLPESDTGTEDGSRSRTMLPGLEGTRGALYEIGVSDDGTFVGLTDDEMDESLSNLRAMASSLGCTVEVTRMVRVGECEWNQATPVSLHPNGTGSRSLPTALETLHHEATLWVAEAHVQPGWTSEADDKAFQADLIAKLSIGATADTKTEILSEVDYEQLRVTLTGPTTSGKSSLLGTLSTGTIDNGRGKSRMSLLKHRHEMVSGVTSSVVQELIGYTSSSAEVINYATGNVSSWNDIHAMAEGGRLVFLSDSAGHPRYRRTTVRGLVGWAPQWTMLCIAADGGDSSVADLSIGGSPSEASGIAATGSDLAKAHLELCLSLEKPLVVVITRMDLARSTLRQNLSTVLSAIKASGRKPVMLPLDSTKEVLQSELAKTSEGDKVAVEKLIAEMESEDLTKIVPIVMTSAVKGTGVRLLHALLSRLPIPLTPTAQDYANDVLNPEQPACLFHVEDVFDLPASSTMQTKDSMTQLDTGTVVAGYIRFGDLSVGDNIVVGPFPADFEEDIVSSSRRSGPSAYNFRMPQSQPSSGELLNLAPARERATMVPSEWHNGYVVSIRNLRLPVRRLKAGQVGTIGIVFDLPEEELSNGPFERLPSLPPRIRKGMVLAIPSRHMMQTGHSLQAASGFTATFEDEDVNSVSVGSLVVVYIASIRASARIIRSVPHISVNSEPDLGFSLDTGDNDDGDLQPPAVFGSDGLIDVTLELMTSREWIELGSQVLIMPGGGPGLNASLGRREKGFAGLNGFVGKIIEVVD